MKKYLVKKGVVSVLLKVLNFYKLHRQYQYLPIGVLEMLYLLSGVSGCRDFIYEIDPDLCFDLIISSSTESDALKWSLTLCDSIIREERFLNRLKKYDEFLPILHKFLIYGQLHDEKRMILGIGLIDTLLADDYFGKVVLEYGFIPLIMPRLYTYSAHARFVILSTLKHVINAWENAIEMMDITEERIIDISKLYLETKSTTPPEAKYLMLERSLLLSFGATLCTDPKLLKIFKKLSDSNYFCKIVEEYLTKGEASTIDYKKYRQERKETIYRVSNIESPLKRCGYSDCNKLQPKKGDFKKCSNCMIAIYCSKECQKSDWILHKKICKKEEIVK